jgi:Coenzyme PQQ synthesis protein D (PqqD)
MSIQYPLARKDKLVVREVERDTLVYDLTRNKALCLNRTAAAVWKASDGNRNAAQIADELSVEFGASIEEDVVWAAIDQLGQDHLLEYCVAKPAGRSGITRRKQLQYMGRAAAIAPIVAAMTAPRASAAQSCITPNKSCTPGGLPCCKNAACMANKNGRGYSCTT